MDSEGASGPVAGSNWSPLVVAVDAPFLLFVAALYFTNAYLDSQKVKFNLTVAQLPLPCRRLTQALTRCPLFSQNRRMRRTDEEVTSKQEEAGSEAAG